MPIAKTSNTLVLMVLSMLALLGNVVSIPLFFGVDFIFGSIFTFILLRMFGLKAAFPSSLLAASYTFLLWNHPYAAIIFLGEFLWVGFFYRRKNYNLVILDALYWILIGIPLVYVFYGLVMELPRQSVLLIMMKQGVNGIFNVVLAYLVISVVPILRKDTGKQEATISFRILLFTLLLVAINTPALIIVSFIARQEFKQIQETVVRELMTASQEIEEWMHDWLDRKIVAVETVADALKDKPNLPSLYYQETLKDVLVFHPDFHNMYLANKNGITTAFYPSVNSKGASTIGLDFSNREYFKRLKKGSSLVISSEFKGKGEDFTPIVTICVPIFDEGAFNGFAQAALKVDHIKEILTWVSTSRQGIVTLVDNHNKVIATTATDRKVLTHFNFIENLDIAAFSGGALHGFRKKDRNISAMAKWSNSIFLKTFPVPFNEEWTIVVEISAYKYIRQLQKFYVYAMLFVFALSLVAIVISNGLSNAILKSIFNLQQASKNLPKRIERGEAITWSRSFIREINQLADNFKITGDKLSVTFEKLHENQDLLEDRIEERTKDLQESMEQTQTIIDTAQDGIISIDENGIVQLFNRAAEKIFKYTAEEVIGVNINTLMPEPYKTQHDGYIESFLTTRNAKIIGLGREVTGRCKDGSVFPMRLAVGEMKQGETSMFVGVITDITEQKKVEQELIRAKEESEEANQLKSEFLNTMSHELRTPLTVILGNIDELTDEENLPDSDEIVDIAQDVLGASKHLFVLINDLLDISKIEAGGMELSKKAVRSSDIIEDAMNTVGKIAKDKNITLKAEGDEATLQVDPLRIKQVILNLLSNAIKFTDEGEVVLKTHLKENRFDIEIRDTGCGMDEKSLEFIFDPFRQVDSSTKRKAGGTGLGLAITQKLVQLHDGDINVSSKLGIGSVFTVSLPLKTSG